jgi:hypothetical protein
MTDSFPEWHGEVFRAIVSQLQPLRKLFEFRAQFWAEFGDETKKGMLLEFMKTMDACWDDI